jgi:hypothetical protein
VSSANPDCHFVASEKKSLPLPVAFVVNAIDPAGAEVVVVFAVIAVLKP